MKKYIKEGFFAAGIMILFLFSLDFIPFQLPTELAVVLLGGAILIAGPLYFLTPSSWYTDTFADIAIVLPLVIFSFFIYFFLLGMLSYVLNSYLQKKFNYDPKFKRLVSVILILLLSILLGLITYPIGHLILI